MPAEPTTQPDFAAFLTAVQEMRKAQRAYFRTKQHGALLWSKQAEEKVDALLEALCPEQSCLELR